MITATPRQPARILDARDFGAKGDGVHDDAPAVQAAIDTATGDTDPATHDRTPVAPVYVPTGTYQLGDRLRIRSVHGFHLLGDGPDLTVLRVASGVTQDSLLEIDGSANGIFENFSLTSDSTGFADKMLFLRWSPAAQRSTSNNNFRNVNIVNGGFAGGFRSGFAVGTDDGSRQVDGSIFQNCLVVGLWSPAAIASSTNSSPIIVTTVNPLPGFRTGDTVRISGHLVNTNANGTWTITVLSSTMFSLNGSSGNGVGGSTGKAFAESGLWQNGWEIGSGTHGNNIDHYLYGCSWAQVRHGLHLNASNALLYGSQPGGAETDVFISGSAAPIVIEGFRGEGSRRLLEHGGGASDCHVSLRDVQWNAQSLESGDHFPNAWIVRNTSGTLHLDNVVCLNPPAGVEPQIVVDAAAGNPVSCIALGVASRSPVATAFQLGTGAHLTIMNYHQVTADNTISAITPLRVLRGADVLFDVPSP